MSPFQKSYEKNERTVFGSFYNALMFKIIIPIADKFNRYFYTDTESAISHPIVFLDETFEL